MTTYPRLAGLGAGLAIVLGAAVPALAQAAPVAAAASTPFVAQADDPGSFTGCPVLVEGQTDPCVWTLQHYLNLGNSAYGLPETGEFGPLTRTAVLDFQGTHGLPADGNVGAETARAIQDAAGIDEDPDIGLGPDDDPATEGGGDMTSDVLAEQCPEEFAPLEDYLTGRVGPPRCFPYDPLIVETPAGTRAEDPYTDGCSGPTWDENPMWDRRSACATHDYGYDLLRYGVGTFQEPDVDDFFLRDMLAECDERGNTVAKAFCVEHAVGWRAGVRRGNVDPGDAITSSDD